MLEEFAEKIARESKRDKDIILYGLQIFMNGATGYVFLIITAYIFNWLETALTAAITASVLRIFTGGLHARTSFRCVLNGVIIFNAIAFLIHAYNQLFTLNYLYLLLAGSTLFALAAVALKAPVDSKEKPLNNSKQKWTLKISGAILIVFWYFVLTNLLGRIPRDIMLATIAGLIWQTLSLFAKNK